MAAVLVAFKSDLGGVRGCQRNADVQYLHVSDPSVAFVGHLARASTGAWVTVRRL